MNPYEIGENPYVTMYECENGSGETWAESLRASLMEGLESRKRQPTHEEIIQAILSTGHPITKREAALKALGMVTLSFPVAA